MFHKNPTNEWNVMQKMHFSAVLEWFMSKNQSNSPYANQYNFMKSCFHKIP